MDERTNKLLDTFKTQGPLTTGQIGDVFATTQPNQPITSQTLQGAGRPINLPQPQVDTTAAGITGRSPAIQDSITEQLKKVEEEKAKQVSEERGKLQTIVDQITGVQKKQVEEIGDVNTPGTIAFKREQEKRIGQKLDASQRAEINQLKALETANMTDAGRAAATAEIRRKSALEQSDLQFQHHLAVDDLNSSIQTLNEKFKLELQPLETLFKFQSTIYDDIRGDLTKAEDRVWTNILGENKQLLENAQKNKKDIADMYEKILTTNPQALTNNPSLAVRLSNANDALEFNQILAGAGVSLIKPEKGTGLGVSGILSQTTQAIINNPNLFDNLTPTVRGQVITELQANGYDTSNLGVKGLSDSAIKELSQTQKAVTDLQELKSVIQGNEQFVGPIAGVQRFNPFSKARQVQADIDRVKQTVGKALEGGVLRKEDEEKYKKILATLSDTPTTAIYKVDALISSITRDIETYKLLQQSAGRSLNTRTPLNRGGQTSSSKIIEDLRAKYNY